MNNILGRIEKKYMEIYCNRISDVPSKVYLGKKEARELKKSLKVVSKKPIDGLKSAKVKTIHLYYGIVDVVRTKHKSYLRVV